PFCAAEAVHAVRQEMAMSLRDVLRRRVPLAILARHDPAWIRPVAERIARELGWSGTRIANEIAALDQPSHPARLP
ncbi:MAG: hypothetical protein H0W72_07445, partial [Planctomycetes bacterium]|nr:hypothetical protein [Planctomycetota bacterium]